MQKSLMAMTTIILLNACASPKEKSAKEVMESQQEITKMQQEADKERKVAAQESAEKSLDQFPGWALQVPAPDGTGVYAVGIADADKVPMALKKAQLEAEYGLAKLYNQELAGGERSSVQDNGNNSSSQYTALIEKLVDYVPVVGFVQVKQEVKAIDGRFHAFILLKLPYSEFNQVIQDQKKNAATQQDRELFEDLERRLEKRREDRAAEALQGIAP